MKYRKRERTQEIAGPNISEIAAPARGGLAMTLFSMEGFLLELEDRGRRIPNIQQGILNDEVYTPADAARVYFERGWAFCSNWRTEDGEYPIYNREF